MAGDLVNKGRMMYNVIVSAGFPDKHVYHTSELVYR